MKRLLALFMVVIMVFALVACGGNKPVDTDDKDGEPNDGDLGDPVTISIGHVCGEGESVNVACLAFKEYVEEKSGGNISVEIFPNGVLGSDEAMIESVIMGTLGMEIPSTAVLTTYSEQFNILSLPYLFPDSESAFKAVNGELGDYLNEQLKGKGITNLAYNFGGTRNMTNNTRPITSVADLKGLKMRVMSSPIYIDFFKLLGANPTPMSFGEVYTGLQQGTIVGQENPASLIYESKFNEVQKYMSITEHVFDICGILINTDLYNSLTDAQRAIVDEGVKTKLSEYQIDLSITQDQDYINNIEKDGTAVNYLTDEAKEEFKEAVAPLYDEYKKILGDKVFDLVEQYR